MLARIFISILCFSFSLAAQAYVPPSAFQLKSIAKKHEGVKAIRIRSVLTTASNSVHLKITTYVLYPEQTLISWASDDQDHELMRVVRPAGEFSPLDALFFDARAVALETSMKSAGLPIQTEAELLALPTEEERRKSEMEFLNRWRSKIAWVVGNPDVPDSPQLWLEKDTFLPLRFVFNSPSGKHYEMQADEYRFAKDFAYPKDWILMNAGRSDGSYLFKEDLTEIQANPDPKSAEYRSLDTVPSRNESAEKAIPADVRELLEMYYGESYGRNR